MKRIITIILIFCAFQSEGQTWTVARVKDSILNSINPRIAALQTKGAVKDLNDDKRNVLIDSALKRAELLLWQSEELNKRITRMEKKFDSAGVYMSGDYYDFDSVTKIITPKPDTIPIIINRPKFDKSSFQITGVVPNAPPASFYIEAQSKEVETLKWQNAQYEQLLDDDKKIIDKLQKKIKAQQKVIDKLKH